MEITKESLEKRISDLHAGKVRLMQDLAATDGAIQDCEYWLTILEKSDGSD